MIVDNLIEIEREVERDSFVRTIVNKIAAGETLNPEEKNYVDEQRDILNKECKTITAASDYDFSTEYCGRSRIQRRR